MKKYIFLIAAITTPIILNAQTFWTNSTYLKGTIGKYPINMTLAIPVGGATPCFTIGEYFYTSKKIVIDLCSEDDEKIIERFKGKPTGYFILKNWNKSIGQNVIGSWHSIDGKKSYPVVLRIIGKNSD